MCVTDKITNCINESYIFNNHNINFTYIYDYPEYNNFTWHLKNIKFVKKKNISASLKSTSSNTPKSEVNSNNSYAKKLIKNLWQKKEEE